MASQIRLFWEDLFLKKKIATSATMPKRIAIINMRRLLAANCSEMAPDCVLPPAMGNLNTKKKLAAANKSQRDCMRCIM